jgi:UDP-N-acetylmuramoyl-tripeptide--D-alanyl-D-alanine ligase
MTITKNTQNILWHGGDVVDAVQGAGPRDWHATGVSIDTRTLNQGDLFIALRGPFFDGHDFIDAAWALGASAVLVQDISAVSMNPARPIIAVVDTFQALRQLALAARCRFQGRLLALTGSVGKTTVKDGLAHVLSRQSLTSASWQSLNNHLGVPLSLARLPMDARYAIFEVGMNHKGEIKDLVGMIAPHLTLITQVSYQHGQFFSNLDDIVTAKAEIFYAPSPLLGILPHDSPHYAALKQQGHNVTQWITFGQHPDATVRLMAKKPDHNGTHITLVIQGQEWRYHWPLKGAHTIDNSLAIVAGAWAMGANMNQVMDDVQTIVSSPGRGNVLTIGGIHIIDESYNAAPASMQASLVAFAEQNPLGQEKSDPTLGDNQPKGKRYIILGEMRELGGENEACHRALVPLIQACGPDGVWLCGSSFLPFLQEIPLLWGHALTISDLMPSILKTLKSGDWVLIKGANSMRTFTVIGALAEREALEN